MPEDNVVNFPGRRWEFEKYPRFGELVEQVIQGRAPYSPETDHPRDVLHALRKWAEEDMVLGRIIAVDLLHWWAESWFDENGELRTD